MTYGSVCSGIESATVAWAPLGWKAAFFSEIAPFPIGVLQHHYPHIPQTGDFRNIEQGQFQEIDLLVGGTPCQDFSLAGLRAGLDGERGQLTIEFVRLAQRIRPRYLVWENVAGVLSADRGRAFGTFLGALAELGYGFAYRVLNARFFGVPQQRRRVFLVAYLGDWRRAAAVLFDSESLCWDIEKVYPAAEEPLIAPALRASGAGTDRPGNRGDLGYYVANPLGSHQSQRLDLDNETYVAFSCKDYGADCSNVSPTLRGLEHDKSHANAGGQVAIAYHDDERYRVRRLTPTECERLQGFPDGYTLIPWRKGFAPDGNRYRALGNAMAVPCMRWLGERIQAAEDWFGK